MLDDYGIRDGDTIDVFYQGKGGASNSLWRNPPTPLAKRAGQIPTQRYEDTSGVNGEWE